MILEKMDDFFETRLIGYDSHMINEIEGASEFYPYTASLLPKDGAPHILDLGCGTGLELEEYFLINLNASITAIDLSEAMLNVLKNKFPAKAMNLIRGSYFDIPLGNEVYDAAVSVESLHHFSAEQKISLYSRLKAALKPGGYFILTDYFAESAELEAEYFSNLNKLKAEQGIAENVLCHYDTPLTVEHEIKVLEEAGFSEISVMKNWGATYTIKAVR